jgi:16S rRNA (uracil1498-N3)-methyltransferase
MATAGDGPGPGPERAHLDPLPAGGPATLGAAESRHLVRVRRAAVGDPVVLFDGRGSTRIGRLLVADGRRAEVLVLGPYPDREPARPLTLAVSLPEPSRADAMVAQLAELGVARLLALVADRTPPGRADLAARRAERWGRLLLEAAKVSGRSRLLEVGEPIRFPAALAGPAVLLDPDPAAPPLRVALPALGPLPALLVGPEGGFTEEERRLAAAAGAPRASLGRTALRIETAAVAAASVALA